MDAITARPSLLSAAKNFIRKSAGTAVVVIAPLAAVSAVSTAQAQTIFASPSTSSNFSGSASIASNFSGGLFSSQGDTTNNITAIRFGADGTFFTNHVSGGTSADNTLKVYSSINNLDIPISTIIPVAYDFTLSKETGIAGNVTWNLNAYITGDNFVNIASGTLTTGSATFTGTGNYTTLNNIAGDGSQDFAIYLEVIYTTAPSDTLGIRMNSATQGFTVNATAIPEPSTYAAILGLGALGFVRLRRSRRAAA